MKNTCTGSAKCIKAKVDMYFRLKGFNKYCYFGADPSTKIGTSAMYTNDFFWETINWNET